MNKVVLYKNKVEVFYNNQKYVFDDFNIKKDMDYWNTLGDVNSVESKDINIWSDMDDDKEVWQANVYGLKYEESGDITIDDNTCEYIEVEVK